MFIHHEALTQTTRYPLPLIRIDPHLQAPNRHRLLGLRFPAVFTADEP